MSEIYVTVKTASTEIFPAIDHCLVVKETGMNPPVILQFDLSGRTVGSGKQSYCSLV